MAGKGGNERLEKKKDGKEGDELGRVHRTMSVWDK